MYNFKETTNCRRPISDASDVRHWLIGWRGPVGPLIFTGHFQQKRPISSGSFVETDLQLRGFYESSKPCTRCMYVYVSHGSIYTYISDIDNEICLRHRCRQGNKYRMFGTDCIHIDVLIIYRQRNIYTMLDTDCIHIYILIIYIFIYVCIRRYV